MDWPQILFLASLVLISFLYSSVGHGGASGYLAAMAVMGIAPVMMKSSALVMNLFVSMISFIGFYRAGHFKFRLFWPFAVGSIPLAFIGGTISMPDTIYKKILAVCIFFSVARMLYTLRSEEQELRSIPLGTGLSVGGGIGLLSGMIGIGGGILLSPIMLLMKWSTIRQTAAVSALFIFVNSVSGLTGQFLKGGIHLTIYMQYAIVATILGGLLGSYYGSKRFDLPTLRYLLAIGLTIASLKLIFT